MNTEELNFGKIDSGVTPGIGIGKTSVGVNHPLANLLEFLLMKPH